MNWSVVVSTAPSRWRRCTIFPGRPVAQGLRNAVPDSRPGRGAVHGAGLSSRPAGAGRLHRRPGSHRGAADHHLRLRRLRGADRRAPAYRPDPVRRPAESRGGGVPRTQRAPDRLPGHVGPPAGDRRGTGPGPDAHGLQPDRAGMRRHLGRPLRCRGPHARPGGDRHAGAYQHHGRIGPTHAGAGAARRPWRPATSTPPTIPGSAPGI